MSLPTRFWPSSAMPCIACCEELMAAPPDSLAIYCPHKGTVATFEGEYLLLQPASSYDHAKKIIHARVTAQAAGTAIADGILRVLANPNDEKPN